MTAFCGAGAGATTVGCDESVSAKNITPTRATAATPDASPAATIIRLAVGSSSDAVTDSVGSVVSKP
jgi:hypothetical protein